MRESGGIAPSFLTLASVVICGQLHARAALPPGERALGTHSIGGWVGPRVGADAVGKRRIVHCREYKSILETRKHDVSETQ
jgi:hypothetical protein